MVTTGTEDDEFAISYPWRELTHLKTRDGRKLGLISDQEMKRLFAEMHEQADAVALFNRLRTDSRARRLLWVPRGLFLPIQGMPLGAIYFETDPTVSAQPLKTEMERAQARLEANTRTVLKRSIPSLTELFSGLTRRLKAHADSQRGKIDAVNEEEFQAKAARRFITEQASEMLEKNKLAGFIHTALKHSNDLALPMALDSVSQAKGGIVEAGRLQQEALEKQAGLPRAEFTSTFESLATSLRVFRPALTVAWCSRCVHQPHSQLIVGSHETPTIACPACRQTMHVGTYYHVSAPLSNTIFAKDGAIGTTVAATLARSEHEWATGCYVKGERNDSEKDLLFHDEDVPGYSIVEAKMYQLDTPTRTQISNFEKDLNALWDAIGRYEKLDVPVACGYLITNLPTPVIEDETEAILADLDTKGEEKLSVYNADNYSDFDRFVCGTNGGS
ncbi:MAG: hypothetical protein HY556_03530 [Euryarchaeota archaeon]|nr:hypothetical protein [Euryarchaeota archaeon]